MAEAQPANLLHLAGWLRRAAKWNWTVSTRSDRQSGEQVQSQGQKISAGSFDAD